MDNLIDQNRLERIAFKSARAYSRQARVSETLQERDFWMNEAKGALQEGYALKRARKKREETKPSQSIMCKRNITVLFSSDILI